MKFSLMLLFQITLCLVLNLMTLAVALSEMSDNQFNEMDFNTKQENDELESEHVFFTKLISLLKFTSFPDVVQPNQNHKMTAQKATPGNESQFKKTLGNGYEDGPSFDIDAITPYHDYPGKLFIPRGSDRGLEYPIFLKKQHAKFKKMEKRNPEGEFIKRMRKLRHLNRAQYLYNEIRMSVYDQLARYK